MSRGYRLYVHGDLGRSRLCFASLGAMLRSFSTIGPHTVIATGTESGAMTVHVQEA